MFILPIVLCRDTWCDISLVVTLFFTKCLYFLFTRFLFACLPSCLTSFCHSNEKQTCVLQTTNKTIASDRLKNKTRNFMCDGFIRPWRIHNQKSHSKRNNDTVPCIPHVSNLPACCFYTGFPYLIIRTFVRWYCFSTYSTRRWPTICLHARLAKNLLCSGVWWFAKKNNKYDNTRWWLCLHSFN